jgi:DNA-binding transcriptional MerR regulator/methylmalonyl-CoA mutase cobalamin-binding subunit
MEASRQTPELTLSISAVERDTGLSKDTLRVWERRYGFPVPLRDANGERVYPVSQVEKLQLIRRLMDRGHRPGRIIPHSLEDLIALGSRSAHGARLPQNLEIFLKLIRAHQVSELRRQLSQALMKQGLQRFVMDTIAPLNQAVGDAWMRGEFAVFEEHLYTEQIHGVLRNAMAPILPQSRGPRLVLTTFPNEPHGLGLLMVEAVLAVEGATCISLGPETPIPEIARAAAAHRADIVGLSFSTAFNERQAAAGLAELRTMLDARTRIWAGGTGAERMRRPPPGVEVVASLEAVLDRAKEWRALNGSA